MSCRRSSRPRRGRPAGARGRADGVELHAHEFFLHAQLLSPVWNDRDDQYGGSFEGRMRGLLETLQSMRDAVGRDFVVGVRLKAADMLAGGMDAEEYCELLRVCSSSSTWWTM